MRLLKIFILALVMALPCVQAEQQVVCTDKTAAEPQIDKMFGFSEGMEKVQCDYVAKKECRYTKESCERSIGCAELIMKKGDLAKTQILDLILVDEIRDYISVAFDANLDNMKDVTSVMDYAKMLQVKIPKNCKADYLSASESSSCKPHLLKNIVKIQMAMPENADAPKAPEYYDFTLKDGPDLRKDFAISQQNHCRADGFKDIAIKAGESAESAKKRITALLDQDQCLKRFITNVNKNDRSISLAGLIDQFGKQKNTNQNFGQFLAAKTQAAVDGFLDVQCTAVPRMEDICSNATKMQKGEASQIKDLYIPPESLPFSKGVNEDIDANLNKFKDIFQKIAIKKDLNIPLPENAVFFRMFEAARCKVGKEKYEDDTKDCSEVNDILKEASVSAGPSPKASVSIAPVATPDLIHARETAAAALGSGASLTNQAIASLYGGQGIAATTYYHSAEHSPSPKSVVFQKPEPDLDKIADNAIAAANGPLLTEAQFVSPTVVGTSDKVPPSDKKCTIGSLDYLPCLNRELQALNTSIYNLEKLMAKECKQKNAKSAKCKKYKKDEEKAHQDLSHLRIVIDFAENHQVDPEKKPALPDPALDDANVLSEAVNGGATTPGKPQTTDSSTTITSTMVSGKLTQEQIAAQKSDKKPPVEAPVLTEVKAPSAPAASGEKVAPQAAQTGAEVTAQRSAAGNSVSSNDGNNIPGTHPLATDANGVPIPPPSSQFSPSYSPSASASGDTQRQQTIATPDTQAIQKKLDDTQAKLDKLTAETEKAKAKADEEEKNALKEKIKKLEEEKVGLAAQQARAQAAQAAQAAKTTASSAPAQGQQPQLASGSPDSALPQAQQQQPQQQQQVSAAPIAAPLRSAAPAVKTASAGGASSAAGSSGGSSGSAGAGLQIVVAKDYPAVDITDPNNIPETVIKDYAEFAKSNKGDFKFNTKNGVFTLVPLVDDKTGAVVGYTAVKEKKAVAVAAKPAPKPVTGPVPASVKPVESANRIRYSDMKKVIDSAK